ncbi:MAG: metal-sensitive transcriptional regulator [Chloroflexota bacterium]
MLEEATSKETLQRLRRIEGQVRGIQRMIDEGRSCEDVIPQVLAARAALDQVAKHVVVAHIEQCLATLPPERAKAALSRAIEMLGKVQS